MQNVLKNRTLKTGILGFFVLTLFITPNLVLAQAGGGESWWSAMGTFFSNPGQVVGNIFLSFSALFTWLGGLLLDSALNYTVFQMGTNVGGTLSTSINTLWSLIRDICNLAFIFGFIYIGIRTIIDPDSATMKRFLSRIIIGALLINFSLFFAKAIIDFSNFTAYQVYTSMTTVKGSGSVSLSGAVVQELGVLTLYDINNGKAIEQTARKDSSFGFFFGASLFLLVSAFTFFAGALLLIVRFVALIFIMVASPLLFAATVFPQTESIASDLWKKLFSYSFFAPLYLLLVLISLKLTDGLGLKKPNLAGDLTGASTETVTSILNFIIIIFFMISALTIASKVGIMGGNMVVSWGNSLRGRAQSAIGRNTLGRLSHGLREGYEKLDARVQGSDRMKKIKSTRLGRVGLGLAKGAAFVGTGGVVGGVLNDRNIREGLGAVEHAKFGGQYSYEDDEKYDKERKARQGKINELNKFKRGIGVGVDEKGNRTEFDTSTEAGREKQIAFERAVADASIKDFEELKQEQRKALVGLMTDSQIEAIEKSDKLTDTEKHELSTERQTYVKNLYADGKVGNLSKAAVGHLATLGHEFLTKPEHAVRLTSSQMDDLKKKLTPTEFKSLTDARKKAFSDIANGKALKTKNEQGEDDYLDHNFIVKQKPGEISKMPPEALEPIARFLPNAALETMVREGTQSQPDLKTLRAKIEKDGSAEQKAWLKTSTGRIFGT